MLNQVINKALFKVWKLVTFHYVIILFNLIINEIHNLFYITITCNRIFKSHRLIEHHELF